MSDEIIQFNKSKCLELVCGAMGIYVTYLAVGLMQEWLIKYPYKNTETNQEERFTSTISLVFFPHFTTFIIGSIYNALFQKKSQATVIPAKNSILCAFFVLLGATTFNYAILWTSYPIVITAKSCNLLSVILVGTLCSRVKDKKLQLSKQKILIGIVVSLGILLFKFFDPEAKSGDDKKFEFIGLFVLLLSLLADGFLPDFQAEIKSKFNPKPTEMMVQINKWVSIFCLAYIIIIGQGLTALNFALSHELFTFHLMGLSILTCLGHFIIYRMIKTFKQHIVPFIITTRKVFTVCISLIFYHHKTHPGQIIGILIVLAVVVYQFLNELIVSTNKSKKEKYGQVATTQTETQTDPQQLAKDKDLVKDTIEKQ